MCGKGDKKEERGQWTFREYKKLRYSSPTKYFFAAVLLISLFSSYVCVFPFPIKYTCIRIRNISPFFLQARPAPSTSTPSLASFVLQRPTPPRRQTEVDWRSDPTCPPSPARTLTRSTQSPRRFTASPGRGSSHCPGQTTLRCIR